MELVHSRRGSGEPLVLIHGIGGHGAAWDPVVERLEGERETIVLDLPGFGKSSPLRGTPDMPTLVGAVVDFLSGLGLERPHVAGNSLGGGIALEVARAGHAASVTALSPIGFWNQREREFARRSLAVMTAGVRRLEPAMPLLLGNPVTRTLLSWQIMSRPWRMPAPVAIEGVRALTAAPGFDATLAAMQSWRFPGPEGLDCPVTIAWGTRDALLIPRQAERARRFMPDANHVRLEGLGHVPMTDDPDRVARVLLEGSATARAPSLAPEGAAA